MGGRVSDGMLRQILKIAELQTDGFGDRQQVAEGKGKETTALFIMTVIKRMN